MGCGGSCGGGCGCGSSGGPVLVFDEILNNSDGRFSRAEFGALLASADKSLACSVEIQTIVLGTTPMLTVALEYSADGSNWSPAPTLLWDDREFAGGTYVGFSTLAEADLRSGFQARLRASLNSNDTVARVRIWATPRRKERSQPPPDAAPSTEADAEASESAARDSDGRSKKDACPDACASKCGPSDGTSGHCGCWEGCQFDLWTCRCKNGGVSGYSSEYTCKEGMAKNYAEKLKSLCCTKTRDPCDVEYCKAVGKCASQWWGKHACILDARAKQAFCHANQP